MERHDSFGHDAGMIRDDLQLCRLFRAMGPISRALCLLMQSLRIRDLADVALPLGAIGAAMIARSVAIASAFAWRADQAFPLARLAGASWLCRDLSCQNFCLLLLPFMSCVSFRHLVACSCFRS